MDALQAQASNVSGAKYIVERVSRPCAAYFDDGPGPDPACPATANSLRDPGAIQAQADRGPELFMDLARVSAAIATLPSTADEMMTVVVGGPRRSRGASKSAYLSALLLDVNRLGFVVRVSSLDRAARRSHDDRARSVELLAIRRRVGVDLSSLGGRGPAHRLGARGGELADVRSRHANFRACRRLAPPTRGRDRVELRGRKEAARRLRHGAAADAVAPGRVLPRRALGGVSSRARGAGR